MTIEFDDAVYKLRWSAEGGTWGALIKPDECKALLEVLDSGALVLIPGDVQAFLEGRVRANDGDAKELMRRLDRQHVVGQGTLLPNEADPALIKHEDVGT